MRSPQVQATIAGRDVSGCLVDGGATVNIISNWLVDDLELTPTHSSPLRLKVADQSCMKSVGMLAQQPITVQGVTMRVDFHILDISEARGGYPIILGRPWLREVKAVDYWEKGNMRIGPHMNRVNVKVIPDYKKTYINSPEDTSDEEYDSTWTSEVTTSDSESETEVDLYALDFLPQVLTSSMSHLDDLTVVPSRHEELLHLVQFGPTLTKEEKSELQGLVLEYSHLFVSHHQDLPTITLEEHRIELFPEAKPVRARQKRMAPDKARILRNELDKLLEGGFITQVRNTEWVSPVVIVPKKGGKWRVCVNYRALNQVTKKDRQPLPHIDELLDNVAGHDLYTFCDGYSGYHQIRIHKEDVLKTTFTTPWGTFAYLRMPFGLCNAGGTFQRVHMHIFGPYIGRFIRVYLNDFAVFSDRHLHVDHVRTAFKRLAEHGCSLSPEKCRIGFEEGPLLGHIVFRGGLRVDPDKVQRIRELRTPTKLAEVSTLWGVINYHNQFIENLAGVARPITNLIRKDTSFAWTAECCKALEHVKNCLSDNPVTRHPDWNLAFIINPTASDIAVAAVLMQNDEAGRAHPIYYASRLLTNCELRYSSPEKLTTSLLFACTKFRHYLLSNPFPVVVLCETDELKRAVQQIEPTGRAARLLAALQQYDLIFKTTRTQRSAHAGLLLELGSPPDSTEGAISDEAECYTITTAEDEPDFGYQTIANYLRDLKFPSNSSTQQRKDIRRRALPFTLIGDTLYKTGRDGVLRRAVNKEEARKILPECHEGVCGGHFATDSTARKILTAGYFWPSLFKDCAKYCQSCPTCQAYGRRAFAHTELHPIFPTGAFEKWGLDFVGALPKTARRNEYLIVATNYLTKWSEVATVKKCTQDVAADIMFNQVICRYGCPLEVITDQGSHFTGGVITKLLSKLSVKHRRVTPYYPQANGMVEKTNGILTGIISKMILDKQHTWDDHVGEALWAYRTTHKLATGYTPFQLVFGFEAVLPIELEIPSLRLAVQHGLGDHESVEARLLTLERLDENRRRALWNNEVIQHRQKERHDARGKKTTYPAGSLVMLIDSWLQKQHRQKFCPKWKGPFVIHQQFDNGTYKLSTPDGRIITKTYNGLKLKAYKHVEHLQDERSFDEP